MTMTSPHLESYLSQWQKIKDPNELIVRALTTNELKATIGLSGQPTGACLLQICFENQMTPNVFILDTLRLFKETYEYIDKLEKHFNIEIKRIKPDSYKVQKMIDQHGEYLFFDNQAKQEFCCDVRKVKPQQEVLANTDVWLTGLRQDQSTFRQSLNRQEIIKAGSGHSLIKLAPLYNWSEEQVTDYLKEKKVPLHPLLSQKSQTWQYKSLGCKICTTPVAKHEDKRAGRWRWFNQLNHDNHKECGIHFIGK